MKEAHEIHGTCADPQEHLGTSLSAEERRQRLAHWMSDIHAVPDHPALRRLADGTLFHIDELTEALRALDEPPKRTATIIPFSRARTKDDDEDPTPGASAAWPTLPPVIIDARAAVWTERQLRSR
jgi:hypothetical protein